MIKMVQHLWIEGLKYASLFSIQQPAILEVLPFQTSSETIEADQYSLGVISINEMR